MDLLEIECMMWTEYGYGPVAGLCVYDNVPLGSTKTREFLDSLSGC